VNGDEAPIRRGKGDLHHQLSAISCFLLLFKNNAFLEIFQLKSVLKHPKFVHC